MGFQWHSWTGFAIALGIGAVAVLATGLGLRLVSRIIDRRHPGFTARYSGPGKQLIVLAAAIMLQLIIAVAWPYASTRRLALHIGSIVCIAAGAWFLTAVLGLIVGRLRAKNPIVGDDDQDARRLQTQLSLIQGFLAAAIWLVAAGIALFTIPGAQAAGTSLLASAGLVSVVVGIAAQSLLGNVFAGLQLAFSGLIRVGDLVTVQAQGQPMSGRVDQITLTAVVLKLWDQRQLVLPSSNFTTTPYQNWTRGSAELLGTVEFDVDWRVSPAAMRTRLQQVVQASPLWDKREADLIVQDAVGGVVRVQAQVSAANPGDLAALRNRVREDLVEWLAAQAPAALPVRRTLHEGGD